MNIVEHATCLVENLEAEGARLKRPGLIPTSLPKPAIACGPRPVRVFVSRTRLPVELVEGRARHHEVAPMLSPGPDQTGEGRRRPGRGALHGTVTTTADP